jgi:hypothetical protein
MRYLETDSETLAEPDVEDATLLADECAGC